MTIEEQIMKLQTYKMYEGEDTVYVERDDVLKALEQTRWIPMSEQYKNKQSNCNKMPLPQPYKAESEVE